MARDHANTKKDLMHIYEIYGTKKDLMHIYEKYHIWHKEGPNAYTYEKYGTKKDLFIYCI